MFPSEAAFTEAARWLIHFPSGLSSKIPSETFLEIRYIGDVAQLKQNGRLLDDNFFNGAPWSIGLDRFVDGVGPATLELDILPLRSDSPIFLERGTRPMKSDALQSVDLQQITPIVRYRLTVDTY